MRFDWFRDVWKYAIFAKISCFFHPNQHCKFRCFLKCCINFKCWIECFLAKIMILSCFSSIFCTYKSNHFFTDFYNSTEYWNMNLDSIFVHFKWHFGKSVLCIKWYFHFTSIIEHPKSGTFWWKIVDFHPLYHW